jgi:hypothetical protein
VAFHYLCGFLCNFNFGGCLLRVIVITFVGGMLQIFDAIMFDEPLRQVAMDNEDLFSLTNTLKLVQWELD